MRKEKAPSSNTIQTVERALSILEILNNSSEPLSALEIANMIGVNRTTTYGLLNTLVFRKYIYKNQTNGKYSASPKMFSISCNYPHKIRELQLSMPYLSDLAHKFPSISLHFGFFNQDNQVQVYKLQMPFSERLLPNNLIGPMHASGVGKIMLAYLPDDIRNNIIDNMQLDSFTKNTITDKAELINHIEEVVQNGYAMDNGEYFDNTICYAFPIFNSNNEIVAAFSLSGKKSVVEPVVEEIILNGLECSKHCSATIDY